LFVDFAFMAQRSYRSGNLLYICSQSRRYPCRKLHRCRQIPDAAKRPRRSLRLNRRLLRAVYKFGHCSQMPEIAFCVGRRRLLFRQVLPGSFAANAEQGYDSSRVWVSFLLRVPLMLGRSCLLAVITGLSLAVASAPLVSRCAPRQSTTRQFRARRNSEILATASSNSVCPDDDCRSQSSMACADNGVTSCLQTRAPLCLSSLLRHPAGSVLFVVRLNSSIRLVASQNRQFPLAGSPLRC
jgi:hypothetical protein